MTAFHATNGPPLGWNSSRFNHCYKSVVPTLKIGSPSSARKILSKKLNTKGLCEDLAKLESARDAIHQQRVCIKLFTGNRWPLNRSVEETTRRLSRSHNRKIKPPTECRDKLPSLGSAPATPRQKYSAQDVQDIVDRLSTYDPEKVPMSKGYTIKIVTPVIYKKKYTKIEVDDIVDRLMEYDPTKFPAESKGVAPLILHELPRQTLARPKKCSSQEVQDLVDRLCEKNPGKWPSENRQRMENAFKTVFEDKKDITPRSARLSARH